MNNEHVTVEILHNSIKVYPWKKRRWNKNEQIEEGTCPKLEKKFMVFDKVFHSYKPLFEMYNKETKTLQLPIGIGKDFVEEMLYNNNITYDEIDNSDKFVDPKTTDVSFNENLTIRDKFQAQAIDFLVDENNNLFHTKLLSLYTGRGKTYCAISSAFRLKEVMLIVSPTLKDQWCEKIAEYTDANVSNKGITILSGMSKVESLMKKKSKYLWSAFYICTPQLLSNFIEKYKSLDLLLEHLGIGILCFDEFHTFFSQNIKISCNANVKHTFYLTATPGRSRYEENVIFNNIMKHIPSYGSETFKIDNYFNIRYVNYNTNPTEFELQHCFTNKGLSGVLYWNYIFNDIDKKLYIFKMLKMLIDQLIDEDKNVKILIYLAKIEHISTFKTMFEKLYAEKDIGVGNYTTAVDKVRKRREIKNNIIFTTIGSGGVGLDIENLRVLFSLVPISSKILTSQMLGRLRFIPDKEVYFYDFCDTGFNVMNMQRKSRDQILKPKSKTTALKVMNYTDVMNYE